MHRLIRATAILLILVLAAVLRVRGIARESLWGDEALSWLISRMSFTEMIRHVVWWEQIPPVHHIVLWFWTRVFGDSEFSLRMPSALAGVAAVTALFVFTRRVLGWREAVAAALILAVAPLHVTYGQEARTYALTLLMAILSTDVLVRLLRAPTPRLQAAYVIASAVLLYCHLYGAFVLAAHQVAFAFALAGKSRPALPLKRWLAISIAIAALYSPWLPVVYGWVRAVNVNFWVKAVTWDDISRAYWTLVGSTPLYLIAIALAVPGAIRLWRRHRTAMPLLLALVFLPVIVPVAISVFGRPSFAPRYAMVACVGLYPLLGSGVAALPFKIARAGLLVVIAVLGMQALHGEATIVPKSPWREAVAYVQQHAGPKDIVVVHIGAKKRLYDYYDRHPELPVRRFDSEALPLGLPLDPDRRVWFIRHEEWATLPAQIRRGPWHIVSHQWFGDILVMELDDDFPPETQPSTTPSPIEGAE